MTGLASFPPPLPQNPYQRLLYENTAVHGLTLVGGVHFKIHSLLRHRRRVRALHFHWPQNYWRQESHPRGPVTWAKLGLFGIRLITARALGYRLVWTIHEVRPFATREPLGRSRGRPHAHASLSDADRQRHADCGRGPAGFSAPARAA